jgi:hypothetical protein
MSEIDDAIHQLQQQQALTVQALAALLQGRAVGADSTEALLYAIDPGLQGTLQLDPPVAESVLESTVESLPKA